MGFFCPKLFLVAYMFLNMEQRVAKMGIFDFLLGTIGYMWVVNEKKIDGKKGEICFCYCWKHSPQSLAPDSKSHEVIEYEARRVKSCGIKCGTGFKIEGFKPAWNHAESWNKNHVHLL